LHRLIRKAAAVAMVFILAVSATMSVSASSMTDLKNQQADLAAKSKNARDVLKEITADKNDLLYELLLLDIELEEVSAEYLLISDELERTNELLAQTEIELADAEVKYEAQYTALKERVRYMYENGDIGYLEMLFSVESFADFLNRLEYISCIVEYDQNMERNLLETERTISAKLDEVTTKQSEISVLSAQLERKKHALEETEAEKTAKVHLLMEDEKNALQTAKDFEDANAQVAAQIRKIEAEQAAAEAAKRAAAAKANAAANAASTVSYNGKFLWPVPGHSRISSGYQWRTSPISGKREFHTGIDIPAPRGTNMIAADAGTVITAGWVNGYGNTVVISHGGGVSTLYGHADSLLVSVGQEVARGQVIARVGSTGWSTGPHLHFQVMENGGPVTPRKYLNY